MRTLKRLLENGDNAAILKYVRSNDFAEKIDGYEALNAKIQELKKEHIRLYQEGISRSKEITELRKHVDTMLAKFGAATEVKAIIDKFKADSTAM